MLARSYVAGRWGSDWASVGTVQNLVLFYALSAVEMRDFCGVEPGLTSHDDAIGFAELKMGVASAL